MLNCFVLLSIIIELGCESASSFKVDAFLFNGSECFKAYELSAAGVCNVSILPSGYLDW